MADKVTTNHIEFTLPRSKIRVSFNPDYPVSSVLKAQKNASSDKKGGANFQLYLIQSVCMFDGQSLTVGDILEKIKGADFINLLGKVFGEEDGAEAEGNA